jgi:hypothetical protein
MRPIWSQIRRNEIQSPNFSIVRNSWSCTHSTSPKSPNPNNQWLSVAFNGLTYLYSKVQQSVSVLVVYMHSCMDLLSEEHRNLMLLGFVIQMVINTHSSPLIQKRWIISSLGIAIAIISSRVTTGFRAGRRFVIFSTCQWASECLWTEKTSFLSFTRASLTPEGQWAAHWIWVPRWGWYFLSRNWGLRLCSENRAGYVFLVKAVMHT